MTQDHPPPTIGPIQPSNLAARRAKMDGLAVAVMESADLEEFVAVSQSRLGQNLPPHVDASQQDAAATSMASGLMSETERFAHSRSLDSGVN